MATNKDENLKAYQIKLESMGRGGMVAPVLKSNSIDEWVQALIKDVLTSPLESSPKPPVKSEAKKLETKLALTDKNPYVRARAEILNKMDKAKRKEIEDREAKGNTNARIYDEFMKAIAELGDKYSNKKS